MVMVEDLSTGVTTQLTDSPFIDHAPVLSGQHIAWLRHNSRVSSPEGPASLSRAPQGVYTRRSASASGPTAPMALPWNSAGQDCGIDSHGREAGSSRGRQRWLCRKRPA